MDHLIKVIPTPARISDLTGRRFGRLVVLGFAGLRPRKGGTTKLWVVRCDCSAVKVVIGSNLTGRTTISCGCQHRENTSKKMAVQATIHGRSTSRLYGVWHNLKARCLNPNNKRFANYGGRGISVCDRWRNSFAAFYADMHSTYRPGLSLDRVDNDKGYSPDNCRWATRTTQARNTTANRRITTSQGELLLVEAAEKSGVSYPTLRKRIQMGWPSKHLLDPADVRYSRSPKAMLAAMSPKPARRRKRI